IISLLFVPAFCSRLGGLFCGGPGTLLRLCRLGLCRRSGLGFRLRLRLALGSRRRRLGRPGPASQDLGDTDHRELVAVAALAPRILAAALLEGDHLVAARVLEHFAGNGGARDSRRAELGRIAAHDKDLAKLDDLAGLAIDPVDPDDVFGGNPVLFSAGLDDCEHLSSSCSIPVLGPVPDRLLSVGLLFVFKGLSSPRKSTRTQRPARHAYGGEKRVLSRKRASPGNSVNSGAGPASIT